ncbi:hypothetical protein [Hyella patelloides]|uniref:hypothetical protein n=1 Tax=Hyella patelloides TaxID=1982969 RepID=UPI001643E178|nr:hypothetical protein [Hyella patelloides]
MIDLYRIYAKSSQYYMRSLYWFPYSKLEQTLFTHKQSIQSWVVSFSDRIIKN